ncbi:MAG TPA: tRNA (adenosine(37)-N6)-dimethylallyltransferase MiaA [Thermoleophilaceae bacterium]|nr:tRNA (adenosine(37)-N6)-dimethylallyltransferase MiaA [Thermoleophilaceae bacterium]
MSADVIAIFGPTGIGKTAVAIELAELLRAKGEDPVAISADALQVYVGLETLSGVASAGEQARLEHRLVSFVRATHTFSVGEFMPLAHAEIDDALAQGRRPIVVGGTGLYLRAALTQLELQPPPPASVRARWTEEVERRGPEELHHELMDRAPWAVEGIEPTDRSRIIRTLELLEMGELEPREGESQLWTDDMRRPTLLAGLTMEREELYRRIDERVEAMVAAGAVEEVRRVEEAGASRTARKALGYQELLNGDVDGMKRRTRQYAKRQLTWMRKLASVQTIDVTGRDPQEVAAEISRLRLAA